MRRAAWLVPPWTTALAHFTLTNRGLDRADANKTAS
jgi:hypothetical protein